MAGINYVLKVVDKASKAIKAPGDEAEKASLKIKEYERQLKVLNDIEMKNQATYFNYDNDIKYNKSKINSGTLTKEEELSARSEIRDLELKKEESAIKGERISKMISSTEGKLQEQKLIKEMKDNTEGEEKNTRGLGDMYKGMIGAITSMGLATRAMNLLEGAIRNSWNEGKKDVVTDAWMGKKDALKYARDFADNYGIATNESTSAYSDFLRGFKKDEEMAAKYMKLSDFIAKTQNISFEKVAGALAGGFQSGNGNQLAALLGTDWMEMQGRGFDNYFKGRDYNGFINAYLKFAEEQGYTKDTYDEILNSAQIKGEKGMQALANKAMNAPGRLMSQREVMGIAYAARNNPGILGQLTREYQLKGEAATKSLELEKNTDIFNLPDAPNSLHNNISLLNNEEVELLSGVGSRAAVGKQTKNNVTIYITNNESETPPERIGEIVKEKIDEYTNEGIEGGTNEYY